MAAWLLLCNGLWAVVICSAMTPDGWASVACQLRSLQPDIELSVLFMLVLVDIVISAAIIFTYIDAIKDKNYEHNHS